jgi:hypothetical protein
LSREISQVKLHSFFDSDEYRLNSSIFVEVDVLLTTRKEEDVANLLNKLSL